MKNIPEISVGILTDVEIRFRLNAPYRLSGTEEVFSGEGKATISDDGKISVFFNSSLEEAANRTFPIEVNNTETIEFEPVESENADFDLYNVVIGLQFHWERKENQRFKGALRFVYDSSSLIAVNILSIEDYLVSVISSEMSATSSPEFLKAHAVISRGWLLAQKEKASGLHQSGSAYNSVTETPDEYCCWYDREDHKLFDVCADDHCQRYQGITKAYTKTSEEAVSTTAGEVMTYHGTICDTRFYKCCGGVTEKFENNWEPVVHPYLTRVEDCEAGADHNAPDLTNEEEAERWIRSAPPSFCNTNDKEILSQVLNDYDQETTTFYRWKVTLTQEQISDLIRRKTGRDFGDIIDLIPVERGCSGRIMRLKIIGTKKIFIIGKELFIRKALSESHLYSSAFIVEKAYMTEKGSLITDKTSDTGNLPSVFTLTGAGWGHGSGLCQIGAAVMGEKGYSYKEILSHYFKGAVLEKIY